MAEATQTPFIFDATDDNFAELVIDNSVKGPVLVNYWSKKVGPCIRQYPVLEKLVQEFGGRFLLVNLNTDDYRALAKDYGITSLPTLKLFQKGKVVETRHGYQDESDMKYMMAKYMPRASDKILTEAVRIFQQGEAEKSLVMLAEGIMEDPQNIRLPLTMARLLVSEGRMSEASQLLANMPPSQRDDHETGVLQGHIALLQVYESSPSLEELEEAVKEDPDNCEALYQLAAHCFTNEAFPDAMHLLYEILRLDRQFRQGAAHQAMMTLFSILGDEHELVREFRSKLQNMVH